MTSKVPPPPRAEMVIYRSDHAFKSTTTVLYYLSHPFQHLIAIYNASLILNPLAAKLFNLNFHPLEVV